ncbi:complement C1q tumor necrosis factor-related protein 3-like [Xiphophorus maculatus]|uniref:complement C1q tumor necrosis factor-related protein 3-like n=1 Tax=Xiphophorus maculatus TaxID=8083 RepID=UPI000C6D2B0C|nr:complement C1q tumor necrosis factor-related protein 3-like [Xiphophorus maculatus]
MTFSVWLLVCFCGLTLGQNVLPQTEVATEIGSCFPDMCKFLKEFGAMKAKLETVETNLKEKSEALETKLKEKQEVMETRQKETENQVLELKKKDATNIAFSAAIGGSGSNGHIGPFNTDTTIIYRKLIINVGNAYNQHTGIFAAPVPGIYYFTFFYHAVGTQVVNLSLMKNNEEVVTTYDHKTSHDVADNGGNAALLQLQQGDQVYVRMHANSHVWQNEQITTFSGVLLRQL